MGDQRTKIAIFLTVLLCGLFLGAPGALRALAAPEKQFNELLDEADRAGARESVKKGMITRPTLEYSSQDFRDPFLNYLPQKAAVEVSGSETEGFTSKFKSLTVEGIIWGSSMPQAIVNNRVIKIGDELEGARVTGINKDGITLLMQDREYKLGPPSASGSALQ